jgi:tetratricopeptide (TPR) repeat protein
MTSYEEWLGEGSEVQILRMLGVFDRPAAHDAVIALRERPEIVGLTDHLHALSSREWNRAVKRLRDLKLMAERSLDGSDPADQRRDLLDAHPLVRQHFGGQLRSRWPEAWKEAHSRLFEYFKALPRELPDTIEEMAPLFHAVAHGCRAGRHAEAWREVYWPRIRRGNDGFSAITLGAYGLDLAALTNFFDECWDRPVAGLDEQTKAQLFSEAGFDLRGLGRLEESTATQRLGLKHHHATQKWNGAANAAGNLSEALVVFGDLDGAIQSAEQSIDYARRAGNPLMEVTNTATLGDALHQKGRQERAEQHFREAERLLLAIDPGARFLHALRGYHFCDLLLELGIVDEAATRATTSLEVDTRLRLPHGVGLAHLLLVRVQLKRRDSVGTLDESRAIEHMRQSLAALKLAGHQELVVRAQLVAAELWCATDKHDEAENALNEAMASAVRGQMRLYIADAYLQRAKLFRATGKNDQYQASFAKARDMIRKMDYGRRERDVAAVAQLL